MKHKITILAILLILSIPSFAQIGDLRNNWSVGFNGGVNINSITISPRVRQSYLLGPTMGVTARYISEKYFSMICGAQVELNYSQRGWKDDPEEYDYSYSRLMNYIELPFLAHLAFGKEKGVRFFVNAGPQVSLLLGEKEKKSFAELPPFPSGSNLQTAQYGKMADNKFDYGIAGGGGLELRTKAGNFQIEGRYYFGLGDFYNITKKDHFSRAAHNTISVRLSYLFDLTR